MILYFSVTWPLEVVLLSASLPSALTGADLAIFAAVFSYVADVTTVESRTLRVTILDIAYLSTMPTGVALGMRTSMFIIIIIIIIIIHQRN
jgi:PCFT/HCP family folate transporter-like MFS transporter 1/3